jgi:hypothetical protein
MRLERPEKQAELPVSVFCDDPHRMDYAWDVAEER